MNERIPSVRDVDFSQYDFLDFGSSEGNSFKFAQSFLGGTRGLGIDRNPKKVAAAREHGIDCVVGDLTQLDIPSGSVRFVIMNHLLEHLPNIDVARDVLASAADAARDFIFIKGPWFDADDYLAGIGLKFYWSDWGGHPLHLTTDMLTEVLDELGLRDFLLMGHDPIKNSKHPSTHPMGAPPDRHEYQPQYGPKPNVQFSMPVFREIVCVIGLSGHPLDTRRFCWSEELYRLEHTRDGIRATRLTGNNSWLKIRRKIRRALRRL